MTNFQKVKNDVINLVVENTKFHQYTSVSDLFKNADNYLDFKKILFEFIADYTVDIEKVLFYPTALSNVKFRYINNKELFFLFIDNYSDLGAEKMYNFLCYFMSDFNIEEDKKDNSFFIFLQFFCNEISHYNITDSKVLSLQKDYTDYNIDML